MSDSEYWESGDSERLWEHIREVYADFIVYCDLKKTDMDAVPPEMTEHTLNSIIKMSWSEGNRAVYNEAVKYAKSAFDDLDFLSEAEAWIAEREGKYTKAIKLMESIEGGKDMTYTAVLYMKRHGKHGELDKAAAIGRAIWQAAKDNDEADSNFAIELSDVSIEIGDKVSALYFIKEALFDNPSNTDALYRLAALEFDLNLFVNCSQTLDHLLDIDPYDIAAWNQQGVVKHIMHDDEGALRAFEYSLSISPDYLPPLGYSSYIRFMNHDFEHAKELMEKLESENIKQDNNFDGLVALSSPFLGFILLKEGKYDEALQKFQHGMGHKHEWVSLLGISYLLITGIKTKEQCGMELRNIKTHLKIIKESSGISINMITKKAGKSEKILLNKFIDTIINPPQPKITDSQEDDTEDCLFNWNDFRGV